MLAVLTAIKQFLCRLHCAALCCTLREGQKQAMALASADVRGIIACVWNNAPHCNLRLSSPISHAQHDDGSALLLFSPQARRGLVS